MASDFVEYQHRDSGFSILYRGLDEIEGAKTLGLITITLLPAAIGISAKAEWKKLVKFAESHRK
jgi:hypothetical protein